MTNQASKERYYTIDLKRPVFDGSELILLSFLGEIGAKFHNKQDGFIEVKHTDSSVIEALRKVQEQRSKSNVFDPQRFML